MAKLNDIDIDIDMNREDDIRIMELLNNMHDGGKMTAKLRAKLRAR